MKDNDFKRRLCLGPTTKARLLEQIERDVRFMESWNICDYSLLVGFHFRDSAPSRPKLAPPSAISSNNSIGVETGGGACSPDGGAAGGVGTSPGNSGSSNATNDGADGECGRDDVTPDRSAFKADSGGMVSPSQPDECYFVGVIDTLTEYNFKKMSEHTIKKLLYNATDISAIPPRPYRQRFMRYVASIID